jgi:hypothetical protein
MIKFRTGEGGWELQKCNSTRGRSLSERRNKRLTPETAQFGIVILAAASGTSLLSGNNGSAIQQEACRDDLARSFTTGCIDFLDPRHHGIKR